MNQILFVPNDYQEKNTNITSNVRKRKRIFILPLILGVTVAISSYKIYAVVSNMQEEKGNIYIQKSEENIQYNNIEVNNTQKENKIIVERNNTINNQEEQNNIKNENNATSTKTQSQNTTNDAKISSTYKASNGKTYKVIANLNIPSLGIEYPVLSSTSAALLKISLNKYWGANPNEVGNMCIVGHNYEDSRFFGKLNKIKNGTIVKITDLSGKTLDYEVYDKYVVGPYDTDCTSQLTNGNTEITLITCYKNGTKRLVVKARAKI